jgi:hypothetical protein
VALYHSVLRDWPRGRTRDGGLYLARLVRACADAGELAATTASAATQPLLATPAVVLNDVLQSGPWLVKHYLTCVAGHHQARSLVGERHGTTSCV